MAFTVTPTPASFNLAVGEVQNVVFAFGGIPADVSAEVTETFQLGTEQVIAALTLTLVAPDPVSADSSTPAGVTRTLLSIDDAQALIRYSR